MDKVPEDWGDKKHGDMAKGLNKFFGDYERIMHGKDSKDKLRKKMTDKMLKKYGRKK